MKPIIHKLWMVMAFVCLSISASAYDFEADGIFYTITSTAELTCEVSGSNTILDELVIPDSVSYLNRNLTVIALGNRAFQGSNIQKVILPNSVRSLKDRCFEGAKIITIENTSNVTFFGKYCFRNCEFLKSIEFGNQAIVRIGGGSFYKCSALETVNLNSNTILDDSNGMFTNEGFFEDCIGLKEVTIDCQILPQLSFGNCLSLNTIVFGENCRYLGTLCFNNCISLVNLTIPSSIIGIKNGCFAGCSSLKSVRIPESVKLEEKPTSYTISEFYGESMFRDCTSLEDVDWNANVIPLYAFEGCTSLNHLTIGGNTCQIYLGSIPCLGGRYEPRYTFDGCNIKYLTILPSDNNLELFFRENGSNWSKFKNSLYQVTEHEQKLLQIFDNVEEVYIARNIRGLENGESGTQYNSLKRLLLGYGCPHYWSLGVSVDLSNLDYLKSEVSDPPYLPNEFTTVQYTTMEVEVPSESLELYKKANVWSKFWNIKGFEYAGVLDIFTDTAQKSEIGRYDMNGRPISEDYQGLVIVRFSDGTASKWVINQ